MLALNTPVGGTLTFWTRYDIEEVWDNGFVEDSTDGGTTWMPLVGNISRTSNDPNSSTAWANSLVGGQPSTDTAITGSSMDFDTVDGVVDGSKPPLLCLLPVTCWCASLTTQIRRSTARAGSSTMSL
jgi:hypothetical protein